MGLFDRWFGPPTEEKFAKIVAEGLRRAGDDRTATYDKAEGRLLFTRDGKDAGILNLKNLFGEYRNVPKSKRQEWIQRNLPGLANQMDLPEDFEDVKPDLLPTLRTRSLLTIMQLDAKLAGGTKLLDMPLVPFSGHLVVGFVYDLPTTMRFIMQEDFAPWDVSIYEALEVARHNLEQRPYRMISVGEKLFVIETDDAYDATRILLTDRIRELPLTGNPVATAVTRNCLLITGADDVDGLGMMAEIVEKKAGEPRPLCSVPVQLIGDEWQTWLPPADHPHYDKFRLLEIQYLSGEYAIQKELLDKLHEKEGEDVFVATFSAIKRTDGKLLSYATWSQGVPTWLPRTDLVALVVAEPNRMGLVPWERVQAVVGHMFEPLDCYPPRWLVTDFPTPEQWEQMQVEVVSG